MKTLNKFIIEKLKLGKNIKIKNNLMPKDFFEFKEIIANKLKFLGDNKEYLDLTDLDLSDYRGNDERFDKLLSKCLLEYNINGYNIKYIDVTSWNLLNIHSLYGFFCNLEKVEKIIGIDDFDMTNVKYIQWMFSGCTNLKDVGDLSKWKFNNLMKAQGLFNECQYLVSVGDISKWDMSNVTLLSNMFAHCYKLENVGQIANWNLSSCISYLKVFKYTNNLKNVGDLTKWNKYIKLNANNISIRYGDIEDGFKDIFYESALQHDYEMSFTDKSAKIKKLI